MGKVSLKIILRYFSLSICFSLDKTRSYDIRPHTLSRVINNSYVSSRTDKQRRDSCAVSIHQQAMLPGRCFGVQVLQLPGWTNRLDQPAQLSAGDYRKIMEGLGCSLNFIPASYVLCRTSQFISLCLTFPPVVSFHLYFKAILH